ncbi:Uncharacterised protein [Mycobacteroides abscessus subsp. abscessus]|nr:Uncharacterised protein [Mycobacteroides abscessus subsp. abscessus]
MLPIGVARREIAAPVGTGDIVGVPVQRAVRDLIADRGEAIGHGSLRLVSGPHNGCIPVGIDKWVAVTTEDSSRKA